MAENVVTSDELLKNIKTLLWGSTVKEDIFKRWAQGSEEYYPGQLNFLETDDRAHVTLHRCNGRSAVTIVIIFTEDGLKIHFSHIFHIIPQSLRRLSLHNPVKLINLII